LSDLLLTDHACVDPMLTACFIRVLGMYPTGAIVGQEGAPASEPARRNTAMKEYAIREMLSEGQAGIRFGMQQLWGSAARP
jgi:hypothetical protein